MVPVLSIAIVVVSAAELPVEAPPIVTDAVPLEELGRYESPRSFDDTVKFYRYAFRYTGGVRTRNVVNLPGIKAVHIESRRKNTHWEGINIYEYQGKVRLYVVMRDADVIADLKAAKAKPRRKSRKRR